MAAGRRGGGRQGIGGGSGSGGGVAAAVVNEVECEEALVVEADVVDKVGDGVEREAVAAKPEDGEVAVGGEHGGERVECRVVEGGAAEVEPHDGVVVAQCRGEELDGASIEAAQIGQEAIVLLLALREVDGREVAPQEAAERDRPCACQSRAPRHHIHRIHQAMMNQSTTWH